MDISGHVSSSQTLLKGNHLLQVHSGFCVITQSNESKEEAKQKQQAEQETQQPLPPAAAGAEANAWFVFPNLWETKKFICLFFIKTVTQLDLSAADLLYIKG